MYLWFPSQASLTPIGMKKFFKTTIDVSAGNAETIFVSAGKIGYQIEISLEDLKKVIRLQEADIV